MSPTEPSTDDAPRPGSGPRFTLISAAYNIARYLPDFIRSIDAQTFPLNRVQVVVVDDGSTDDTAAILAEWQQRRPELVTVVSKVNGGQGSARNVGIEHATGEWISFPDPDDWLAPDYLQQIDAFLRANDDVAMAAGNRFIYEERTDQIVDGHQLRRMFRGGDRVVDPEGYPDFFHGAVNSGFYRADLLTSENLRFDLRVRPNFEDGHFSCRYLLAANPPRIGFVASAQYIYRRRADNTSTLQTSKQDPDRYLAAPRFGYLDVLRLAIATKGAVPEWLQNCVLYELSFYFSADVRGTNAATVAHGEVAEKFVETLAEIAELLDPAVIEAFNLRPFDAAWRDVLMHALKGENWFTPYAVIRKSHPERNRLQIAYRYAGKAPDERVLHRGSRFTPQHAKVRTHVYWEQPLLKERLMWIPATGVVRLYLDGKPVEFRGEWPGPVPIALRGQTRRRLLGEEEPADVLPELDRGAKMVQRLARTKPVRRIFRNAWVLIDRLHNADDNAERLFRFLRQRRRDINAWFVLEKDTPDYRRLKSQGYRRVVPVGSLRWKLLMLNARHVASSHLDHDIYRPAEIVAFGPPQWRFTFLQHGVIKDDISRWVNAKAIDLFITSTVDEHESIAGDETPYAYTSYEVKRAGLPRFDRLRELGAAVPPEKRRFVLLCPTWRHWLTTPSLAGNGRRDIVEDFLDTEYVQMWLALLHDEKLRVAVEDKGLTLGFMPHPMMQPMLDDLPLPPHVTPLRFAGEDVQQTFADAAVVVTDYSSMAFNAAYIERPVVYFQFDTDRVLGGGHIGRYGYFDYERDGFGPVAGTVRAAADAIVSSLAAGPGPAPEYLDRIRAAFPDRDGRCCARVVAAIEGLDAPRRRRAGRRGAASGGADGEAVTAEEAAADEMAAEELTAEESADAESE